MNLHTQGMGAAAEDTSEAKRRDEMMGSFILDGRSFLGGLRLGFGYVCWCDGLCYLKKVIAVCRWKSKASSEPKPCQLYTYPV